VLDIVVFGATGFVGRLVAEYLAEHAPPEVTVGIAGRSQDKLAALGLDLPIVVADAEHPDELAKAARVVATTVGPYRRRGIKLVDACIAAGTDYCVLTGETLFVKESIERHERAQEAGARIVHSVGFDSVPSDLGVYLLHEAVGQLGETTLVVEAMRGGFSGGTLASMKGQIDEMRTDKQARRAIADPNALSPGRSTREPDVRTVAHSEHGWVAPFVMATYNTRIVRRSAQLLGYGPDFAYKEVQRFGNPLIAAAWTGGLGALAAGLAFPASRLVLDKVLPAPGEGPSEQARANGYFRIAVHGAGRTARVAAKGDPGYAATAVMMGESALTLALNEGPGGVLTPASAMGAPLIERLRAAGLRLTVE
jgi:short subunit dehydrogenase-like uncharacterized protein